MSSSKGQELLGSIISKAWEDPAFKEFLVKDPIAAIEQVTGQKLHLPEGKTIVVRDQTDESTIFINIPAKETLHDVELSDDQLETVAGGGIIDLLGPLVDALGGFLPKGPQVS